MKKFAVRIQEGARPHLRIVRADTPDDAAVKVIEDLGDEAGRLLGAKIAVWEHGTLRKSLTPLFIKSVRPLETTPDIHVIQALREKQRRARWLETRARAEQMKERASHEFEEPYEKWLAAYEPAPDGGFFALTPAVRHECIELRDRLKHVPPGEMTEVQARFAALVSGFHDLDRFEMHQIQERMAETLEMVHHHLAGLADQEHGSDELPPLERLAQMIGAGSSGSASRRTPAGVE